MPGKPGVPINLTREQRIERGRNAAKARTTPEHYIRQLGKVELTREQADELVRLVAPYLIGAVQR